MITTPSLPFFAVEWMYFPSPRYMATWPGKKRRSPGAISSRGIAWTGKPSRMSASR